MKAHNTTRARAVSIATLILALGMSMPLRAEDAPAGGLVLPPLPDVSVDVSAHVDGPTPAAVTSEPTADPAPRAPVPDAAPAVLPAPGEAAPKAPGEAASAPAEQPATPPAATTVEAPSAPASPAPTQTQADAAPASQMAVAVKAALDQLPPARTLAARREREGVVAFYAARDFAPLWVEGATWTGVARKVIGRLERAEDDALDLRATPIPSLQGGDDAARASADVGLSLATVAYARQAGGSRVDPLTISKLITDKPELADPAKILASVSAAADPDATLVAFNPMREGYKLLRTKLAELRREQSHPMARIEPGPILKVGMKDARVPLIRAHFRLEDGKAPTTTDDLVYDTRVASAVADFQRANGLPASGQLTPRTIAVLSGGQPARLEAEIIANMERWRWLPHQEAADRIEVNIPDYKVTVFKDNAPIHRARVIVGKPNTPTPIFSNRMQFIEVNPYWNVPDSIIKNEMLPKMAADPTYLQRMGYEVSTSRNGRMIVRQPPGERNALGRIKFMFPNQHAVYLHDTPTRNLFGTDRRAYSHGCVRVDNPFKLAEIVLGRDSGWTEDKVKRLIGGANRTIHLPKPLDIHIGYFTAFVDDAGKLQLREDIYGYSHKLKLALGLEG